MQDGATAPATETGVAAAIEPTTAARVDDASDDDALRGTNLDGTPSATPGKHARALAAHAASKRDEGRLPVGRLEA